MKISVSPEAISLLSRVSDWLSSQDIQAYLVGGFVRDMLLGRETKDIDIAVDADAPAVSRKAAAAFGGKYILLDEANQIGRVVLFEDDRVKWQLDFSTLRGNIQQDLAERDFTIDAMAVEPGKISQKSEIDLPDIIDPFDGRHDLEARTIRAVSDSIFTADAARLLRAVRLAANLDFNIDARTEALVRQSAPLIAGVAGERVREELLRILASPGVGEHVSYLDELGLLTALIPELEPARGVTQPFIHYWTVFEHLIHTSAAVEFLTGQGQWPDSAEEVLAPVPWSDELSRHFAQEVSGGSTRRSLLKLIALLHDIAKPQTRFLDETGRARFLGHPQQGAEIAAAILERLRFSAREIKLARIMIENHLRPTQMSPEGMPTRRAIYRYFRDTGDAGIDILFLSLADHLATRGPKLELADWREHARMTGYVLEQHFAQEGPAAPPKLIDGHDIMNTFGMTPGPKVGELLEAVHEAQAAGEVNTREEARAFIEHLISASKANDR
ncbi:MAG: HD domain-containing protein [Dehalococcoidales bacterium]|nr:HD domain-containing protein [Dehalococcoidales bacterium]